MGQSLETLTGSYLVFKAVTTYKYVPIQMLRYEMIYTARKALYEARVHLLMYFMGLISLTWAGIFLWKKYPNYFVKTSLIGIAGGITYFSKPFIQKEFEKHEEASHVLFIMENVDRDCRLVEK